MKMSKTMRTVIGAIMVLIGIMMQIGNVAFATYETEEVPVALIEELLDDGFVRDEDETNIWTVGEYEVIDDEDCDYSYGQAWFDTDENVGMVTAFAYNKNGCVVAIAACTIKWNGIEEEMEVIAEFDMEDII